MLLSVRSIHRPALLKRSTAYTALIGAVIIACPFTPAAAQTTAKLPPSQSHAAMRQQTIDQRIDTLHAELKITPAEEADWRNVAQTMRDNAAAMEKLVAEKSSQRMTAVENLQTYEQFAEAHVDGLKKLTASFETLYDAMPDPQKKLADQVFDNARHQEAARPS